MRKFFLLCSLTIAFIKIYAYEDLAITLMLMNNYNIRQADDIWMRMRAGFQLPHGEDRQVRYYEKLYTKNPKAFNLMMSNAKPYLYYILTEIERRGLPTELALIPGVESTFDPLAKNSSDVYAGMWQFVPLTGRRFNMVQNDEIDERRDIIKSTQAALNYLNYLHIMFHQWDVAIGAYNLGEGGMYKAVLASGQRVGKVAYDELPVRKITQDYWPKIVALANIIENPRRFGITLEEMPNEPFFAIINPAATITTLDISKLSGSKYAVFNKLNPQYKDKDYALNTKNSILLPLANQRVYYASIGKNLIANNTNLQLAANQTDSVGYKSAGAQLAVALNDEAASASKTINDANDLAISDTTDDEVKSTVLTSSSSTMNKEDELNSLIDTLEVKEPQANKIVKANVVKITDKEQMVNYTVNQGDTLYSISKKFNTSVDAIGNDNSISNNIVVPGQVLKIRTNSSFSGSKVNS